MPDPLVSVVTPFYNTEQYLAECIESVLRQTFTDFEYILVDNCSTDRSREIALDYARRDARIRLIRRSATLPQVRNYNCALKEISEKSKYCKIVQADDWIFYDCLRLMVQAFEQSESIGLVSAYDVKGNKVRGSGFPVGQSILPGRDLAQLLLRTGLFVFGSPTTVMYRSSLIRGDQPFYDEHLLHEDTEKCMQILQQWDFGFVHQVLSFLRTDNINQSVLSGIQTFRPEALDRYIIVQRYAEIFLGKKEAAALRKDSRKGYYRILARAALRFRERGFWRHHAQGLKTLGQSLDLPYLVLRSSIEILWTMVNPGDTAVRAMQHAGRLLRRNKRMKTSDALFTLTSRWQEGEK